MKRSYYNTHTIAHSDNWFKATMDGIPDGKFLDHPWYLPGGGDIDPTLYGKEATHTNWFNNKVDSREVAITRLLLEERAPMIGVCRGHQIITAAAGGTLYQDMWADNAISGIHRHGTVDVKGDTVLAEIFSDQLEGGALRANSLHHQATRDVPPGWEVGATAPDGIIESIYNPAHPEVVSVQWHPEMLYDQFNTILDYLYQFTR
jgi:putative glutamine amidotransferase